MRVVGPRVKAMTPDNEMLRTDPLLAEIVRRLRDAFNPERIYLFGSRARGEAGPDADVDLAASPPLLEDALFHAQQATKKAMKGFLTRRGDAMRQADDLSRRDVVLSGLAAVPGALLQGGRGPDAGQVTVTMLAAFADAWNRHDVDALMSFMTDDCVFEASAGNEVAGTRHVGRDAVRAGYTDVFKTFPDARWDEARHFVCGDRGVSEWTFRGTRTDGAKVETQGCDLFTFRGGKIRIKNSYRKNRPPVAGRP